MVLQQSELSPPSFAEGMSVCLSFLFTPVRFSGQSHTGHNSLDNLVQGEILSQMKTWSVTLSSGLHVCRDMCVQLHTPPPHSYPRGSQRAPASWGPSWPCACHILGPSSARNPSNTGRKTRQRHRQAKRQRELSALPLGNVWPCVETNLSVCHLTEGPQWSDPPGRQ